MGKEDSSNLELQKIRREYAGEELREESVEEDPIRQFGRWFEQAVESELPDPNAMSLATASGERHPSVRIVLLKGFDEDGFQFFTNYESRKGKELAGNPKASLCFYWPELSRQVRIEGTVSKLSREQSERYFHQRPRLSQISAWTSSQSSEVESREKLESLFHQYEKKFEGEEIPTPEYWGGYVLSPRAVEFWQGRPGRLHDRLLYTRRQSGEWTISRLAP